MTKLEASDIKISQTEEFCEACQIGMATELSHRAKDHEQIYVERTSGLRKGLSHSDLMGPIESSLSGCQYILT